MAVFVLRCVRAVPHHFCLNRQSLRAFPAADAPHKK
jgi:hypothetical protein